VSKNDEKPEGMNPFGHYRAKANLKRRGEEIVQNRVSNNTVSDLQYDYAPLVEALRQVDQYVQLKRQRNVNPSVDQLKNDFADVPILVGDEQHPGYASDSDLQEFVDARPTIFSFARDLMARRWKLTRASIDTNLKPHRNKSKKS